MVFSSMTFLFRFLPVFLIVYYIVPPGFPGGKGSSMYGKNLILFLGSLVFYAWGEPVYVLLMLFSCLCNYGLGLGIESCMGKGRAEEDTVQNGKKGNCALWWLTAGVVLNIGLLCVFKYADLLITSWNTVAGEARRLPLTGLPLPIGISFYTFQALSYIIDVYRGEVRAQRNPVYFCTYVSMFPQLIAGPIVKYKTVGGQLADRRVKEEDLTEGLRRFLIGLGKKVLLANQAGVLWDMVSSRRMEELTAIAAWIGILSFAFQIYYDFSGYSDMAIGLGRMLGFYFEENFNYPYTAGSVTQFWRRWHMSLGGWFRDYVYIPLGGNRCGKGRQILNVAVVWALTGLWHGAAWNFLLWGLWFAVFLCVEKLLGRKPSKGAGSIAGHLYTLAVVLGGWVIFALPDTTHIVGFFAALAGMGGNAHGGDGMYYEVVSNAALFVVLAVGATPLPAKAAGWAAAKLPKGLAKGAETIGYALLFLLCLAFLVDATYNPFLYFRF